MIRWLKSRSALLRRLAVAETRLAQAQRTAGESAWQARWVQAARRYRAAEQRLRRYQIAYHSARRRAARLREQRAADAWRRAANNNWAKAAWRRAAEATQRAELAEAALKRREEQLAFAENRPAHT